MILVDTSAWIEFFRGRGTVVNLVDAAIENDDVACCGPVITELRRGLRSKRERGVVLQLLEACHWLDQPARLWEDAGDLGLFLQARGATVKTLDLLIATYALEHDSFLLTTDADFGQMLRRGVPLRLVEMPG